VVPRGGAAGELKCTVMARADGGDLDRRVRVCWRNRQTAVERAGDAGLREAVGSLSAGQRVKGGGGGDHGCLPCVRAPSLWCYLISTLMHTLVSASGSEMGPHQNLPARD
jgi:hypothetical protein